MKTRDGAEKRDGAADGGERCLCIIKNVVGARNGRAEIGWGDVFPTNTDLYFVRYDIEYGEQGAADGLKYTLGGLLVGGPAGALVGAAVDGSRASSAQSKHIEQLKQSAARLRKGDFGLLPSERLLKRAGAQVHRADARQVDRIADWWISLAVPGGTFALGYQHAALGLAQGESVLKSWVAGNLKASRETEGANAGVPLDGFLTTLCGDAGHDRPSVKVGLATAAVRRPDPEVQQALADGARMVRRPLPAAVSSRCARHQSASPRRHREPDPLHRKARAVGKA